MSKILEITLGIVTALGGFVDIGELVFALQAGAKFHYLLLWSVIVGAVGIIVFSEMCGRIAAVAKRPVFELIRERLGFSMGYVVLNASIFVNIMTCTAEIGGVAIALQLLSGFSY